jgi:hypothetical protein
MAEVKDHLIKAELSQAAQEMLIKAEIRLHKQKRGRMIK